MAIDLDIRSIESCLASEIYISAVPKQDAPLQKQAREIFTGISDVIRSRNACILQERIFAAEKVAEEILRARAQAYGHLDDRVAPSHLLGRKGMAGPISGVQVHAISSDKKPEVVNVNGSACGRILRLPGCTILTLSSISAPQFKQAGLRQPQSSNEQARTMMERAESALKQYGADLFSVARTWMWLGDILSWYGDFNRVRNGFFTERGLIGMGCRQLMPASTGIGLYPADGGKCAMDLIAVLRPCDSIQHLPALGRQQCALEYGSAFSRASRAITPAGEMVFVSGTASIDAGGNTANIGDPLGQINTSIENVRAVLKDMHVGDEDVVQVVAYCKTTQVEEIFNDFKVALPWPWVTVICDICRAELLFEIEVTAMTPRKTR
jgi:enamine deaminase RidA (YjgF/YER057c/UK114 family)